MGVAITRLEFTPDGKKVLVQRGASAEAGGGSTDLIDLATGRLAPLPFDAPELWFGADGKLLAARRDSLVTFDADGKPHRRVVIPTGPAAHVTPAGHVYFVRREDGPSNQLVVRRAVVADPANQAQFTLNLSGPPTAWAVAPDGKTVAVAVNGRIIRFFDIEPPKSAPAPKEPPKGEGKLPPVEELRLFAKVSRDDRTHPGHTALLRVAAWSADGKLLATADENGVLVWDVAAKQVRREFDSPLEIRQVRALAFRPDGGALAVSYGADDQPVIELWHLTGDRPGSAARGQRFRGHAKPVTALAFSPDGALLVTGSHDHTARVFRAADGTPVHALALNEEVRAVAFTPSGAELITREWGGRARVWEVRTGGAVRSWEVKADGRIVSERFLPDGRTLRLLIDSRSGVSFQDWDWTTGGFVGEQVVERHQALRDSPPALAPGGRFVAYTSEDTGGALVVRDTASDRRKTLLAPDRKQRWAAHRPLFSPDGRYLVASGPDGLVAIFRLAERGQLPELPDVEVAPLPRPRP